MTEDELREAVRVKRLREQVAAKRARSGGAPESAQSGVDKARGSVQSYLKGALLGFGDEVVGAGRAALDNILPDPGSQYLEGDDINPNPGNDYAMYRDDERGVTKQFEEENPWTAGGLNLAGGFLSPVNKIAPGYGGSGPVSQRLVQSTARGFGEGAIQGFGEGEGTLAEQLDSAETGALWGGGASAAMTGVGGGLGRAISRRREGFDDLVQPDGSFKPVTLADQTPTGRTGRFFREFLGGGSGGHKLGEQERPYIEGAAARYAGEEAGEKTVRAVEADKLAEDARRANLNIDRNKQYNIDQDTVAVPPKAPETIAQPKVDPRSAPEALEATRRMARAALPNTEVARLQGVTDPRELSGAVNKYWGVDGDAFREVKGGEFELPDNLQAELQNLDAASKLELGNVIDEAAKREAKAKGRKLYDLVDVVDEETGEVIKTNRVPWGPEKILDQALKGKMSGEVLMALRNSYAIGANKGGGMKSGAQRRIANKLDDLILDNFGRDSEEAAKFIADKTAYPNYVTYNKGIEGDTAALAGKVATPKELFNAGKRQNRMDPDTGIRSRPLEGTLRQLDDQLNARIANEGAPVPVVGTGDRAAQVRAQNQQIVDAANEQAKEQGFVQARAQAKKKADLTAAQNQRAADPQGPLQQARAQVENIGDRATPQGRSMLSQRLADSWMGGVLPGSGPQGSVTRLASGIATGLGGTTEGFQKAAVGQAEWQKQLAEALRSGDMNEYTRILSRFTAGQATGE